MAEKFKPSPSAYKQVVGTLADFSSESTIAVAQQIKDVEKDCFITDDKWTEDFQKKWCEELYSLTTRFVELDPDKLATFTDEERKKNYNSLINIIQAFVVDIYDFEFNVSTKSYSDPLIKYDTHIPTIDSFKDMLKNAQYEVYDKTENECKIKIVIADGETTKETEFVAKHTDNSALKKGDTYDAYFWTGNMCLPDNSAQPFWFNSIFACHFSCSYGDETNDVTVTFDPYSRENKLPYMGENYRVIAEDFFCGVDYSLIKKKTRPALLSTFDFLDVDNMLIRNNITFERHPNNAKKHLSREERELLKPLFNSEEEVVFLTKSEYNDLQKKYIITPNSNPELWEVALELGWSSDGKGVTEEDALNVETIPVLTLEPEDDDDPVYSYFDKVLTFDELRYFRNVKVIEPYSFALCENLNSIDLRNIEEIGDNAFIFNINLKNVIIGENCKVVGEGSFASCYSLVNLNLCGVVELKQGTFNSCFNLKSLSLNPNCEKIGEGCFRDCYNLTDIVSTLYFGNYNTFNGLTEIEIDCFDGCKSLKSLEFPNVTKIAAIAFYGCESLEGIIIDKVTEIGFEAFENCSSLRAIRFNPNENVLVEGRKTFAGCKKLMKIDNIENVHFKTFTQYTFTECESLETIDVANIGIIFDGCFESCTNLTNVLNLNVIEEICQSSFSNCPSLNEIDITGIKRTSGVPFKNSKINVLKLPAFNPTSFSLVLFEDVIVNTAYVKSEEDIDEYKRRGLTNCENWIVENN